MTSPCIEAPTEFISAAGTRFAYREAGPRGGVPLVLLNYWGAVLDNSDPRIIDGLAARHHVIAVNYRGIGASGGSAPVTIDAMARDAIAMIGALGFSTFDLMGFSLGGMVAQDVALKAPDLVRKLILTGTGPARGEGIANVGAVTWPLILKGIFTFRDPKTYLFSPHPPAAATPPRRLSPAPRNGKPTATRAQPRAFLRQLKAIHAWGRQLPQDLGRIRSPVLVANGEADIMVPTPNGRDMARRIPGAELVIYTDAGHGGIFQHHTEFLPKALAFLAA